MVGAVTGLPGAPAPADSGWWLALSTSGGDWSIWLGRGADARPPYGTGAERSLPGVRGQSRDLIGVLADTLASRALTPADLAGLVVDSGPGSFTSLRMGLATGRALAWAQQLPVAAVSSLDAMATQALHEGAALPLACVLPARRGWWYVATYQAIPAPCPPVAAVLATRETAQVAAAELARYTASRFGQSPWSGAGPLDGDDRAELGAAHWLPHVVPHAAWMARTAALLGRWTDAQLAIPEYLAVSEAEAAAATVVPDVAGDAISQFHL